MVKKMYIPAIITVTGLVLIFCYIVVPDAVPVKQETSIKHFLPSEDSNNLSSGYQIIEQSLKKKKVIHLELTGDVLEDDKKVAFVQFENRRLQYTNDTSSIIEIHLANEITYGRFVGLVNLMLADRHKKYGLWKNNFYILFSDAAPPVLQTDTVETLDL